MSSQKRGGAFNHYADRNQHFNKKQRSNQPAFNSGAYDDRGRNGQGKPQQRGNAVPQQRGQVTFPQTVLSADEMRTGLVALLDRFEAAETSPDADKDILYHTCELRRLLCARNEKSVSAQAKRDLDEKRPDKMVNVTIPDYIYRKVDEAQTLPPLPPILEPHLHEAVFTHKSVHETNANVHQGIDFGLDYERLEFLGDAYIELLASRALYNRFPQVEVPQLCSWRERLVENLALGKFSEAYGLPDRLKHKSHWDKDTKAWKKVVADLFEAYIAGIVLSDPQNGFGVAERFLDQLWAPQLLGFKERIIENPMARDELQKLCMTAGIKLGYREEKPMTYDHGVQRYYLGVYLTGWGYEQEWLGSGEGQNKAQACIAAATDAIKRNSVVLQNATKQKKVLVEAKTREREEKAKLEAAESGQGEERVISADVKPDEPEEIATKKRKSDSAEPSSEKSKKHKKDKKEKKEKKDKDR
ncbi:ribonuclease III [Setomelanomma holmii]|uniref:Ribonuclease III n=1 Tax=Setomelanomma holmii TaxID=210430 RepID=A0A9P4H583_9PLEO|nr:ribonuclease III [Setomelanomma holmii]